MNIIQQVLRVEVEKLTPRSLLDRPTLQLITSARTSGMLYTHRRHFLVGDQATGCLVRVVPIGEEADGITYGEMDFRISLTPPEIYFSEFVPQMLEDAGSAKSLVATLNSAGMDLEKDGEITSIRKLDLRKPLQPQIDL